MKLMLSFFPSLLFLRSLLYYLPFFISLSPEMASPYDSLLQKLEVAAKIRYSVLEVAVL